MSAKLIARSPDLKKLQDEGYEIEVRSGFLMIHSVPYVKPNKSVAFGVIVTDLALNDDVTQTPKDHQVWFAGEQPCHSDGLPILALGAQPCAQTLCDGLVVSYRFSAKAAYPDYHAKMTQYVEILCNPARVHADVSAVTHRPIVADEAESVFLYTDTASSRAGISKVSEKLDIGKIAVVGLGGTGSYVLDLLAKTPVREIHLFDGDRFLQHNAFRAPGAASLDELRKNQMKVEYYASIYSKMRRGIISHPEFITVDNVELLRSYAFIFLCVDRPRCRKQIADYLIAQKIPFIDVGMELELIQEQLSLVGACRVTLCSASRSEHFNRHVSLQDREADDLYATNIQVADMNALNASLAVLKWKKYCGFYQDCYEEYQSVYATNAHQLTRDEIRLQ